MDKIKLLYIGDYSNTGFGTVAKGLLRGLHATGKYEILQIGINFRAKISKNPEPWRIVAAGKRRVRNNMEFIEDPYGLNKIPSVLDKFDPDIVFVNNDYDIALGYMVNQDDSPTALGQHRSLKVLYSPVDSEPVPRFFADVAKLFDLNIAYSDWHRQLMMEHDPIFEFMPVLYHGYDHTKLFPMDKKEAREKLIEVFVEKNEGADRELIEERLKDNFFVYFVGANQFRKDIPCLFRAFALFHDVYPKSVLVPHTNAIPWGYDGWRLSNLQALTGVENAVIMRQANVFSEEEMNLFYNAADVLAYPTRGEGFGLPSLEAMAVKTPVIATGYGPQLELHRNGRGYFIEIRDVIPGNLKAWSYYVLPDHRSLSLQLEHVHNNPEDAKQVAETAYEWAKDFTWENQAKKLDAILDKLPRNVNASNL